jgi:hypothetical protein
MKKNINMAKILFSTLFLFFLISGTFVVALNPVSAAESVGGYWNTQTSMSQARYGLGVVAVDGKIYAIGGWGVGGFTGANERYDPKTDTWATLASMPSLRYGFAAVEYQGKIYCIGGALPPSGLYGSGVVDSVANEVYDIATNSWSTKASSPSGGRYMQACVVDGKIFVLDRHQYSSNLYMYDPITDVWTTKNSMPGPLYIQPNAVVMVATDGKLIVIDAQSTMIYDPKNDVWQEGAPCPTIIYDGAAGVTSGVYTPQNVYVLGTGRPSGQSRSVMVTLVYDPVGDIWSSAEAMPTYRRDFGVAVVDDVLYTIGGWSDDILYTIENPDGEYWTGAGIKTPLPVIEQYVPFGYAGTLPPVTAVSHDTSKTFESVSPDTSPSSSNSGSSNSKSTNTNSRSSSTSTDTKPQQLITNSEEVTADNNVPNDILSTKPLSDTSFTLGISALIAGILTAIVTVPAVTVLVIKKRSK